MFLRSKHYGAAGWCSLSGSENSDDLEHLAMAFQNLSTSLCSFQESGLALITANVLTVSVLFSKHKESYQTQAEIAKEKKQRLSAES